ncbi:MAG: hypothetical protein Q8J90_00080 [Gallionella sp.]|nr:hypothetical protein [Gallionella sp.]
MTNFDFITSKEFRESLESDYNEMRSCVEADAWKSVQVLAGSIVESLLIDYLSSTQNPNRTKKDPLKLDLAEAISICREEKVLSERASDLCSVVKSYRNLIHPGRMVRLEEQAPNMGSATVAQALIDMITDDLAKVLRASVGLTSEQILSKIERDANSLTILKHLLAEVSEPQRERLLLELIPSAHQNASVSAAAAPFGEEDEYIDLAKRLESAYRIILETVSTETRKRVALEFVRVLRVEDGERVLQYGSAFFRPIDLEFLSAPNIAMVREHLIGNAPSFHNRVTANRLKGIAPYLEESHVTKWLDPFVRALVSTTLKDPIKQSVRACLMDEVLKTSDQLYSVISNRLQVWIDHFTNNSENDKSAIIQELKTEIEDWRIPF